MLNNYRTAFLRKSNETIQLFRLSSNTLEKSSSNGIKIDIPKYINRSSTDILKAISSTIQRDPTAAHFKYHDDPYLIPVSNFQKRAYALSQESGRKSAHWILNQHPELFNHKVAFPPIEKFFPKVVYDENYDLDENELKIIIKKAIVSDAIAVYDLLKKKDIEISSDTQQSLLELVCFYNNQDDLEEDWIEERWYTQANKNREEYRNTWKSNGFAMTLFSTIKSPNAHHYSIIIQGMAKYNQFEEAYNLYKEANEKGFILSINAYNSAIKTAIYVKEGADHKWLHIQEILTQMYNSGVPMNLWTLNSILNVLTTMTTNSESKKYALKTIAEAKQFDIEPCLASYYYLLQIFCSDRKNKSTILVDILNLIEEKSLSIKDLADTNFFTAAMENCRYHLQNVDVALRVHSVLLKTKNYNLIGDSYKESVYYRHLFAILCQNESVEFLMKYYNDLVPHIYIPEPAITELIVKTLNIAAAVELYPKIWSDILMFDQADREPIIIELINGMALNLFPSFEQSIKEKLSLLSGTIYDAIEERKETGKIKMLWTGTMLGNLINICLFGDNINKATEIIVKLHKNQNEIIGIPDSLTIATFLDYCIENNYFNELLKCIEYSLEVDYLELDNFISKILTKMTLSPMQRAHLSKLVGTEHYVEIENKIELVSS
ncbi:small ribosomal subunit protein mS39 [Metopolophium dirhodum]|uniref:small ribosomal subunit protein mS39 n=1 Tax=Metopolophium dirhodum TaxID=44670 RepID=UPI00298FF18D|nr:small ribosomal subunit protein mS39 [Metopolophium dirhodum]